MGLLLHLLVGSPASVDCIPVGQPRLEKTDFAKVLIWISDGSRQVTNIDFSLLWVRCRYSGFFPWTRTFHVLQDAGKFL